MSEEEHNLKLTAEQKLKDLENSEEVDNLQVPEVDNLQGTKEVIVMFEGVSDHGHQ